MRHTARTFWLCALLALAAAPALADCPDGMREFRGTISSINSKKLFVDSRMEDNVGFERAPDTRVVDAAGRGRGSWDAIQPGDAVVICWRFEDRPRKARIVTLR